ncbi:MAG: hypothetical protein R3F56_21835 [Planctomycetota bacterium]
MIRRPYLVGSTVLAACIAALCTPHGSSNRNTDVLHAMAFDPFQDSDGDLLPDALEWVTLSSPTSADSDHDGRDDFLEAVQYTSMNAATPPLPIDQEMRVVLSSLPDPGTGERYIWLHCLFRFASGQMDLQWFMPFLSTNEGVQVPISSLFGSSPMNIRVRPHPTEGAYAIATLRLARARDFAPMLPCMVNARASMSGRFLSSSIYVFQSSGEISTLVPAGKDTARGVLLGQSLAPHDGTSNSFFAGNRVCAQTLIITGQVPGGYLCEVDTSQCQPANGLRCNTDCPTLVGRIMIAPDGPGAITGG